MNVKKIFALMLATVMLFAAGCDLLTREKTFTKNGMSITLTNRFEEDAELAADKDATACYISNQILILALEMPFETMGISSGDMTLDAFGQFIKENLSPDSGVEELSDLIHKDGLTYFTYMDREDPETPLKCVVAFYETSEGFWLVELDCVEDYFTKLEEDLFNYAKSVTFED